MCIFSRASSTLFTRNHSMSTRVGKLPICYLLFKWKLSSLIYTQSLRVKAISSLLPITPAHMRLALYILCRGQCVSRLALICTFLTSSAAARRGQLTRSFAVVRETPPSLAVSGFVTKLCLRSVPLTIPPHKSVLRYVRIYV